MAFLDAVRDALAPDDTKGREQLDILKKAATGELNDYLSKFLDRFKNPDGFKEEILPKRMFDQMKQYRVNLDEGASDQIAKIVDTFFEGTEEGLKNGFKEVIKFAFQAILGSTSVGESQTQNWYITIEYGALIRTDIMAWRYNFSSDGVIAASKNAFCYTITKSFVDPKTLDEQMLVYFVARSLKLKSIDEIYKSEVLKNYVTFLQKGWNKDASLEELVPLFEAQRAARIQKVGY